MRLEARLSLFVAGVAAAFVYVGNAIPQIATGPVERAAPVGETPEALVAAGKRLFTSDRAQCLTCHSLGEDPKARCPNQEGLGVRAPSRRPGLRAAEYLVEAVYDPNAFIVPGYPQNQMQPVHRPPIALSHDEILAVLSFLNTLGGTTDAAFVEALRGAQEPWRRGLRVPGAGAAERPKLPVLPGDPERGRALTVLHGCTACHRLDGAGPETCPDLSAIGGSQSAEYLLESVIDPSAVIVKGYAAVRMSWRQAGRGDWMGVPVRWEPTKEAPERLVLSVTEAGKQIERTAAIAEVRHVGDAMLFLADEDGTEVFGEFVAGSKAEGVTLRVLEDGRWVERRFPPETIDVWKPPASPMPTNFAEVMTPQEIFDVVTYLRAQTGAAR